MSINGTGVSQPTGIEKANTWDDTNSFTVAAASSLTYANVCSFIGLLKGGYDYNAKMLMSKKTLYEDFMPIMDKSKNDLVVRDATTNSYVIMGYPVMLSDSVAEHDVYLGNFRYLVGNLSQNITVDSSAESGFRNNSIDFRGSAMFDCKPALGEAFVKLTKAAE
jgi:HK97 family phage major capsid protein